MLKQQGHRIVAFTHLPFATTKNQLGNQLPTDLLEVHAQGRWLGREFAVLVDAWEMVGEPDTGYCYDLPDRVAAFQKTMYLGIKAGARDAQFTDNRYGLRGEFRNQLSEKGSGSNNPQPSTNNDNAPIVLMGALGLPPGPWLERAAANGLLDYTDAYNFHFYGWAEDLTGVIESHRAAMAKLRAGSAGYGAESKKQEAMNPDADLFALSSLPATATGLPLWITECGLNLMEPDDFLNPTRRKMQAEFTLSTARQALAAEDVAVFMPFILVHDNDGFALTVTPNHVLPAWDAYAKFTRENPWPERPLARKPPEPNPVVMQWLPDNRTCVRYKVGGSYRFNSRSTMRGELRIYNLSETVVEGVLNAPLLEKCEVFLDKSGAEQIRIKPQSMIAVTVELKPRVEGYFRERWSPVFIEPSGRRSPVAIGLEAMPTIKDFTETALALHALERPMAQNVSVVKYEADEAVGVWRAFNGLKGEVVSPLRDRLGERKTGESQEKDSRITNSDDVPTYRFWVENSKTDALKPTAAMAGIHGLPEKGFIRLLLNQPMAKTRKVLIVLVDDRDQRYCIWENFGVDYFGSRSDVWLNLEDIHANFWGAASADYTFRAERIREIWLRFYLDEPGDKVEVKLSLLSAKR